MTPTKAERVGNWTPKDRRIGRHVPSADIDELAEAEPELRAGVAVDRIELVSREHQRCRPPAIAPREALIALKFEATFLHVVASMMRNGEALGTSDQARLVVAVNRIAVIVDEAIR